MTTISDACLTCPAQPLRQQGVLVVRNPPPNACTFGTALDHQIGTRIRVDRQDKPLLHHQALPGIAAW